MSALPKSAFPARGALRDRYINARFAGVASCAADLHSAPHVIRHARLYFEDGLADLALELLDLAAEEMPWDAQIALARLELMQGVGPPPADPARDELAADFHRAMMRGAAGGV